MMDNVFVIGLLVGPCAIAAGVFFWAIDGIPANRRRALLIAAAGLAVLITSVVGLKL